MSEFVTIQVGQCGNQIGSVFWPLIMQEYGLLGKDDNEHLSLKKIQADSLHCFFSNLKNKNYSTISEMKASKVKARALLIDMEESVVQRFQSGQLKDFFDQACSLTNYPGSGNNWAVGYYTHGNEHKLAIEEMLSSAAEKCDYLHCFLMLFSLGGGTGSGLGSYILSLLEQEFPKIDRIATCVHPGINNDVVTSPYNIALSFCKLLEHGTFVLPVDNKALLDLCERLKAPKELKTWKPYKNVNSVIAKMLLNLTSGARFPGSLNLDIKALFTNMVPYPRLNFLSSSIFPIKFPKSNDVPFLNRETEQIYRVCSRDNQLLRIDPIKGCLFAAALISKGKISHENLHKNVERLNKKFKFVKWAKPGLKLSHCSFPSHDHSNTYMLLTNTTSMAQLFDETLLHFNKLYQRKAHVHHYVNTGGFSIEEFAQAQESLLDTINQYKIYQKEIYIPRFKVI